MFAQEGRGRLQQRVECKGELYDVQPYGTAQSKSMFFCPDLSRPSVAPSNRTKRYQTRVPLPHMKTHSHTIPQHTATPYHYTQPQHTSHIRTCRRSSEPQLVSRVAPLLPAPPPTHTHTHNKCVTLTRTWRRISDPENCRSSSSAGVHAAAAATFCASASARDAAMAAPRSSISSPSSLRVASQKEAASIQLG
jgi:hypothetical protein